MNQKGFPWIIIGAVILIAIVGLLLASTRSPQGVTALNEQCNEMETKFDLDENNNVWEDLCIDPNDEQLRTELSAAGVGENIPTDSNSIIKINCHKEDNGSWTTTYEQPRPCTPNQACDKNENEQIAQCVTQGDGQDIPPNGPPVPEM